MWKHYLFNRYKDGLYSTIDYIRLLTICYAKMQLKNQVGRSKQNYYARKFDTCQFYSKSNLERYRQFAK